MNKLQKIVDKAYETEQLSREEIILLLKDDSINEYLYAKAHQKKQELLGNEIHLRALIEISNICLQNCLYCGLRRDNSLQERYKLSKDEILFLASTAKQYGYKTIVLQGGESNTYPINDLCEVIQKIKKDDIAITLSIGEKTYEEYKLLKEAGADRFLLRIETTDCTLYEQMDPGMSHENRKRCLRDLKALGYETGSGSLVGLPGQTIESIADDILFFKEIDADMLGIGPFIAHQDTPLKDVPNGNLFLSLRVMAIIRLLMPDINIPATTAMEALHPNGRMLALTSGANVLMPNFTDEIHRKMYEIYPGKAQVAENNSLHIEQINKKIKEYGLVVSKTAGYRWNRS